MSNYFVKAIIAATTALFSMLLAGCHSPVLIIEAPPKARANQFLVELEPKLSVHYLQPMFMVEALGFKAVDETGWDWAGSDEIYAIWKSNKLVATLIVENVDSGDSFDFDQTQSCIYPISANALWIDGRYGGVGSEGEGSGWVCKGEGGPGPIKFSATFYDDDNMYPSNICFQDSTISDCEDTFVGKYIGTWSNEELRDGWPAPGTVQNFTVRLNPCKGPAICGDRDFPDYNFHFRITRMADKEILPVNTIE